jgi:hypothetical protein
LFRRDTTTSKKIDLLILIKATVVDNESYGAQSQQLQQMKLEKMGMEIEQDMLEPVAVEVVEPVILPVAEEMEEAEAMVEAEEAVAAEVVAAEDSDDSSVENEEILALVKSMDEPASTNATENAGM